MAIDPTHIMCKPSDYDAAKRIMRSAMSSKLRVRQHISKSGYTKYTATGYNFDFFGRGNTVKASILSFQSEVSRVLFEEVGKPT
jgi:hypothetical protein